LVVASVKLIEVDQRHRRTQVGQDPVMAVRLPRELIERIDEWMKACDARSRSDAIRGLIELGLDRSAIKVHQPEKPRQRHGIRRTGR
jgi:Arc/MetJ-type ribon-helix-helix transcriptional regulator